MMLPPPPSAMALLSFLAHGAPVYVIGRDVFSLLGVRVRGAGRRIASLTAESIRVSERLRSAAAGPPEPAMLRAAEHLAQLKTTVFVMQQLLPYLRFIHSGNEADLRCPPHVEHLLARLTEPSLLARLPHGPSRSAPPLISATELAALLLAPAEIWGSVVIPLEDVTGLGSRAALLELNGRRYERRLTDARPLASVLRTIETQARERLGRISQGAADPAAAKHFLAIVDELLGPPPNGRPYRVVYDDRHHQLQEAHGRFVLVRRLVTNGHPSPRSYAYVGLQVGGPGRTRILSHRPRPASTVDAFFTPTTPQQRPACIGRTDQYNHLRREDLFSDAEALVFWLDAGRILWGGRPRRPPAPRGR